MKKLNVFLGVLFALLLAHPVYAQFGQNKVNYDNKEVQFYQSTHADFYHWQDIEDEKQIKYLEQIVQQVDNSYGFLSTYLGHELSRRPSVVFYRTQSTFAATYIIGNHFIPEGVLAFAEPGRYRLAIKVDLSLEEYNSTITHEMAHIFQFDMGPNLLKRIAGGGPAQWVMEGGAEFLGNEYNKSRTDDLRGTAQRGAGANPEKDMPTLEELNNGATDPYTFGSMTLEFIADKYGQDRVKTFLIEAFKAKDDLSKIISSLTDGVVTSSEQFDELQRDYWRGKFGPEMFFKSRPYQEDDHFKGRYMVPRKYPPYPMITPVVSPDGKKMAIVTVNQKYGVVLAVVPTLEVKNNIVKENEKKSSVPGAENKSEDKGWQIEILTPHLPPKPYENISLGIDVPNISWVAVNDREYIAFFAQDGRDHKLFIVDPKTKKILRSVEIPLDQALSPSLSSDGKKVYFSAAKNITRDIYMIDLESGKIINLTDDDAYDESPVVSPDGTKIAYVSFVGSFRKLFLLDLLTGDKKQLTFNQFNDQAPSFSDNGKLICYTSDEKDGVSNLYTFDLETNTVSQRTDFYGRVFTPRFARGETEKVYYTHYWQYRPFRGGIYQNFELFEAILKSPYRQYVAYDEHEPSYLAFQPARDIFPSKLDSNQLLNPTKPPERWGCSGGDVSIGVSSYWGMFGQSYFGCSNLLETKHHLGRFASYGSFRIFDYSYLNQEKRTGWQLGARHYQLPLYYKFYDVVKRYPQQVVLNNTWMKESSFDFSTQYPLNKFNRWELFSRLRHRSFNVFGFNVTDIDEKFLDSFISPTDQDIQMFRFLRGSNGSNLSFGAAYVRDTVLYSSNVQGPWHGNALRAQIEVAPPLGKEFDNYVSTKIEARTYRRLTDSIVFAGRIDLMTNSGANGDFMLLCGPERGRGCDYGSIAGNEVAYGSAELRFPIPGTYVLFQGIRGFIFGDAAYARFSNSAQFDKTSGNALSQKLKTYGFGAQYTIPFMGLPAQSVWRRNNGKWEPTFYITMSW